MASFYGVFRRFSAFFGVGDSVVFRRFSTYFRRFGDGVVFDVFRRIFGVFRRIFGVLSALAIAPFFACALVFLLRARSFLGWHALWYWLAVEALARPFYFLFGTDCQCWMRWGWIAMLALWLQ